MALPKPTNALLRECKKLKLANPFEKVFCDLLLAGWSKEDAYAFSGLWNPTYSTLMNIQDMNKALTGHKGVIEYIDSKVKEKENLKKKASKYTEKIEVEVTETDIADELSKETQLRELIKAKKMHPEGSKEWLDIKKMIADITRVKQDEIKEEDELVHFYVPIQCHNCSLYEAQKKKLGK